MTDFTYTPPEPKSFMHTLRRYFDAQGDKELAALLIGATCEFHSDSTFSRRWNAYWANLVLKVRVESIPKLEAHKEKIMKAAQAMIPPEVGYDLYEVEISPFLESPPDDDEPLPNAASLVKGARTIEHDGLHFRSKTETRVYDELKKRNVLFFANATAVLGGKNLKREPDFLVCMDGRWGILEVMGEHVHTNVNAMRDHDRARLFKDYGLVLIEFYDATRCYNAPAAVVDDFLKRLAKV